MDADVYAGVRLYYPFDTAVDLNDGMITTFNRDTTERELGSLATSTGLNTYRLVPAADCIHYASDSNARHLERHAVTTACLLHLS